MKPRNNGFSLIEVMIAVAIIGLLMGVALPSYNDYVLRGRLTEAYSALATVQPNAEQFWANTRSYASFDTSSGVFPAATPNFTYALSGATQTAYTVTATGRARAAGFVYTIDQQGNRATTAVPAGWTTSTTCWVDRRNGQCSQ
ncbi:type IV pilin protein [Massilia sp. R2A-15]|uniref:type IV pilin protein n=1 Tax=Massilia sp. R2A-15 TaxID=3064278 RepID=UPI0027376F8B|nr:type IV pilin protein [Massilia sp. R2A-15]WLI91495.1 type IV pilin protein [Massilia sp. R2A-15]